MHFGVAWMRSALWKWIGGHIGCRLTRLAALDHAIGAGGAYLELPSSGLEGTSKPKHGLEFWIAAEEYLTGASAVNAPVGMCLVATAGGGFTEHCRHEGIAGESLSMCLTRVHRLHGLDETRKQRDISEMYTTRCRPSCAVRLWFIGSCEHG